MSIKAAVDGRTDVTLCEIAETDIARILEGYALLQQALGCDAVEDLDSFLGTVSSSTNAAVVPKLVCATRNDGIVGIIVGQYLRNLNIGLIAYSGVRAAWRRRDIYTAMRREIIDLFNREAARGVSQKHSRRVDYVLSELDEDGWLYQTYLDAWNGIALPCDYEQPSAQGLESKPLRLVLQPVGQRKPPTHSRIAAIVRELYERVYRIEDVDTNSSYRRIVASLSSFSIRAT